MKMYDGVCVAFLGRLDGIFLISTCDFTGAFYWMDGIYQRCLGQLPVIISRCWRFFFGAAPMYTTFIAS